MMTNDITKLKTKNWQHKLGTIGGIVSDLDDIDQCYKNIIEIKKGQIPLSPNLGTDIIDAIGENPDNASKITEAILLKELPLQEPRGEIISLSIALKDIEKLCVKIHFKSKLSNQERIKEYYVNR